MCSKNSIMFILKFFSFFLPFTDIVLGAPALPCNLMHCVEIYLPSRGPLGWGMIDYAIIEQFLGIICGKMIMEKNNFYHVWLVEKSLRKIIPEKDFHIWLKVILYRNMVKFINMPVNKKLNF